MLEKENPVPLAGGNRAGIRYAVQQPSTREILKTQAQQRLRRQHLAQQVHRLGARVLFELLAELGRHHGIEDDIGRRLERYAELDPEVLRALGGDRFPPAPLRLVGGAA
jgi:hypothetical protein